MDVTPNTLFAFGINHRTAPVDVREKLYLPEEEISSLLHKFKESLSECLIVSTCNRTEFYGVSSSTDVNPDFFKDLLIDFKNARHVVRDEHFFTLISCAACQQLFSVATSVDSKIIGDSQILKQLRDAYTIAREQESIGKVLNQLLQRSFKIGKKTFTETAIHHGTVSVSLAAVELALETFGALSGRSVLIVGGGETARLTAEALLNKQVGKLLITNRTRSSAEDLLATLHKTFTFEGEVVDFGEFTGHLSTVDIVISATSSERPIIYKADVGRREGKVLLIDIAVPRDIDVGVRENPNVVLKNIDDLHSIVDENRERRMKDLPKVKKLIMQEMVEFLTWYYSLPLIPSKTNSDVLSGRERAEEMLRIKSFLSRNVSEIHKLAADSGSDFRKDLQNHFSLVDRLQTMMIAESGV